LSREEKMLKRFALYPPEENAKLHQLGAFVFLIKTQIALISNSKRLAIERDLVGVPYFVPSSRVIDFIYGRLLKSSNSLKTAI